MEIEKAFAEERAVWWTLEERGPRSANASPRGSLTGARALRRGDFASQRSVSGTERGSNPFYVPDGHRSLIYFLLLHVTSAFSPYFYINVIVNVPKVY